MWKHDFSAPPSHSHRRHRVFRRGCECAEIRSRGDGLYDVAPDAAQWILSGSNNGNVQGQLSLGKSSTPRFAKAYSGASLRAQAHRLADDVVLQITGVKGIAETRIAFKVDTGSTSEIYVADFDGHNAQPVTRDGTIVAAPCWVPGQLAIYYTSYKTGTPNIFFQDLATGERRNFAHYGRHEQQRGGVAGRPQGGDDPEQGRQPGCLCLQRGRHRSQATDHTREDESSPCWSPDGRWICFAGKIDERRSLCKVSVDGGPVQRIPPRASPARPNRTGRQTAGG